MLNWYKNQKTSKKFLITFSILIILIIFIGLTSYRGVFNLKTIIDQTANIRLPSYELLLQIDRDLQQAVVAERTLISTHSKDEFFNKLLNDHSENLQQSADRWEKYKTHTQTEIERQLVAKYEIERDKWEKITDSIVEKLKSGSETDKITAINLSLGDGAVKFEHARNIIDQLTEVNDKFFAAERIESANVYTNVKIILFTTIFIAIALSIIIGYYQTKIITVPLLKAKNMLEKLSIGNLSTRLNLSLKDEIGEMADTMDEMADNLKQKIDVMTSISKGNLDVDIHNYPKEDEITPGLEQIVNTLNDLNNEIHMLSEAGKNGDLKVRGNSEKFDGIYLKIIKNTNEVLDYILSPIMEGSKVLEIMATGDLTARVKGNYNGDHRIIKDSINNVCSSIGEVIENIISAVNTTSRVTSEVSSGSEEMAAGAHEQSAQASEIANSVEQMTETIIQSTKNANEAAESAKNAGRVAAEGGEVVKQTVVGIENIAKVVSEAAATIKELGNSSDMIGNIVQVIDDIADQTNLLALNAAIEAARAGEQGRGFAVVADEVRKLAERTTKATKEIAEMIRKIQQDTADAVTSIGRGTTEVESGKKMAQKAGETLQTIISSTDSAVNLVEQVAVISEEQASAAEQISANLDAISSVSHESAAGAQQIAAAINEVNHLTDNLEQLVHRFKVNDNNSNTMHLLDN